METLHQLVRSISCVYCANQHQSSCVNCCNNFVNMKLDSRHEEKRPVSLDMVDIANVDIQQRLAELCIENNEAHVNTLLYISMVTSNGHVVTGHVDLAERVSKVRRIFFNLFYTKPFSAVLERRDKR